MLFSKKSEGDSFKSKDSAMKIIINAPVEV